MLNLQMTFSYIYLKTDFLTLYVSVETNRTECVNNLRKLFMSVHDEDFLRLASKVLVKRCDDNDTMCTDERSLFIDLVGGHGSPAAQKVFLDLVVLQPNVSEEDMSRFLFHCIALKNPIPVGFCFTASH